MPTLARLADNGCVQSLANGTDGQVMTMVAGAPAWAASTAAGGGASSDANNILVAGSDGSPWLSCEEVMDCVGTAAGLGFGLTYNDVANSLSATGATISSGAGVPAATANAPTIYTDTLTGDVYYRDSTGAIVELTSHFTVTAGPDATTVTTGPIDVGPDDTFHLWGNTLSFSVVAGSAKVQGEMRPIAKIVQTSKIALTGAVDAGESAGDTLTYAWAATTLVGTGTATFSSAAAAAPTLTFSAKGSYRLTLTVTDASGYTDTATHTMVVDRILYVNGTESDQDSFATLQAAHTWVSTNDAANAALYLIRVESATTDAARITPTLARTHFANNGSIAVGVDFTAAGTYQWSADSNTNVAVSSAAGDAITVGAGASLQLSNIGLQCSDAAASGISANASGAITVRNCVIIGAAALAAINLAAVTAQIRILACAITGLVSLAGCTSVSSNIEGCEIFANAGANGVSLTTSSLTFTGNRVMVAGGGAAICYCARISAPAGATGFVLFANNTLRIGATTGAQPAKGVQLETAGAGAVRITGNTLFVKPTNGIALHMVGAPPADLLISQNTLEGTQQSINSTSDAAATTALAWANAPFINNTLAGPIANTTFAAPAAILNGDNVQR